MSGAAGGGAKADAGAGEGAGARSMQRRGAVWLILAFLAVIALGGYVTLRPVMAYYFHGERGYGNTVPELGVNGYARFLCSCLFVSGRDEASCLDYARLAQLPDFVTSARIDPMARTVHVRSLLFWTASARWVDERSGCRLD